MGTAKRNQRIHRHDPQNQKIHRHESQGLRTYLNEVPTRFKGPTKAYRRHEHLRVEFLLKTDGGYPRDAEVTLFTLATPGSSLRFNTIGQLHQSPPSLRVEFLLKTDSGYPKDTGVALFTLGTPGNPLCYNTHRSAPSVSALSHSRGPRKRSQAPVSRTRT